MTPTEEITIDSEAGSFFNDLPDSRRAKRLSANEKKVLYGLVKYPLLNDRELAIKLGFKMSTLTAIKNRLKKDSYFFTVRIPYLNNIGCELLTVSYGSFNPLISEEDRMRIHSENMNIYQNIFYSLWEANQGFSIGVYPNYTESKKANEQFEHIFSKNQLYDKEGFTHIIFPYELTSILMFFDFLPLLHKAFGVKEPLDQTIELKPAGTTQTHLTQVEKKIFYGLVTYPDLPDKQIAELINVTRQSIARARKVFETSGIIKTKRIVNLKKLGFEILALAHVKFRPESPISARMEGVKKVVEYLPSFFWVGENLETVVIGAYRNFEELQQSKMKSITLYKKLDFLKEDPMIQLFSIPNMKILRNHKYGEMVKNLLEI